MGAEVRRATSVDSGLASPLIDVRAASPAQAPSGTMYGTSEQSDSTYTVNLATGAWTLIGSAGVPRPQSLAWDGGTMYGVDGFADSTYTVDLTTGAWTAARQNRHALPDRA